MPYLLYLCWYQCCALCLCIPKLPVERLEVLEDSSLKVTVRESACDKEFQMCSDLLLSVYENDMRHVCIARTTHTYKHPAI